MPQGRITFVRITPRQSLLREVKMRQHENCSSENATEAEGSRTPQLWELTLTEASSLICEGKVTSRKLVETWLARIADYPQLNAFISVDAAAALNQADMYDRYLEEGGDPLPLGGLPIAVKDSIHVVGFANTAGTPALAHYYPKSNAAIVKPLLQAGAIVVGKTNMHELAFGASGYNTAFHSPGVVGVRNAFDQTRIAGGSSSGSGCAVGARLIPAALGTDTGGSIRQPGALNGCVGFRPTIGRYPSEGITPISPTRDTPGPIACSVEDVILLDSIITGALPAVPPKVSSIRLGLLKELWTDLSEPVQAIAQAALAKLAEKDIQLVLVSIHDIFELNRAVSMPVALHECRPALIDYLSTNEVGISFNELVEGISSPDVRSVFEEFILPGRLPGVDGQVVNLEHAYVSAIEVERPKLIERFEKLFKEHQLDALIHPATLDVALKSEPDASRFEVFARLIRNADPASNASMPGISLPAGLSADEGLPVGIEIDGQPGRDAHLLSIAGVIESILGRGPAPERGY